MRIVGIQPRGEWDPLSQPAPRIMARLREIERSRAELGPRRSANQHRCLITQHARTSAGQHAIGLNAQAPHCRGVHRYLHAALLNWPASARREREEPYHSGEPGKTSRHTHLRKKAPSLMQRPAAITRRGVPALAPGDVQGNVNVVTAAVCELSDGPVNSLVNVCGDWPFTLTVTVNGALS